MAFIGDRATIKSLNIPQEFASWQDGVKRDVSRAVATDSAWFNAVVRRRASGVRSVPVRVSRNGQAVEELPFGFDIPAFLYRASVALDTHGAFYGNVVTTARGGLALGIEWLDPTTIQIMTDAKTGLLLAFERVIMGRVVKRWVYDEATGRAFVEGGGSTRGAGHLVWAWTPGTNELGPGDVLAQQAKMACQTLYGADLVMNDLFKRGTVSHYLVQSDYEPPAADKERWQEKLRRAFGRGAERAHSIEVLNSMFTFNKIGTDPKDLDIGQTREALRDDISALAETPRMLIVPSDASNRSVIDRATQSWIHDTIEPQAAMILDAINKHVLEPAGYELATDITAMEVDQDEEATKAGAWATYVANGVPPTTAAAMLGIDIPEGMPFPDEVQQPAAPEVIMPRNTGEPMEANKSIKAIESDYANEVAALLESYATGEIDAAFARQAWRILAQDTHERAFRQGAKIRPGQELLPNERAKLREVLVTEFSAIDSNMDRLEAARES